MIWIKKGLAGYYSIHLRLLKIETAEMKERRTRANQTSMLATGQRRRLGAWLLLGWAAFWLTAVVQPFCSSFAAIGGPDEPTPLVHAAELITNHAELPSRPSHPDTDCADLSVVGPGIPNAATAAFDRVDLPMTAPLATEQIAIDNHARPVLASGSLHPPSSGVPLYLRNQRLLI